MLNKIGFISYTVTNLQQSINFYQNLLGLKLLLSNELWAEFDILGQRFTIHKKKSNERNQHKNGAIVYFEVSQIEAIVKNLKNKGVKFCGEIEVFSYGKLVLFLDPDNNSIGLYELPLKD
mgnify:FL=1